MPQRVGDCIDRRLGALGRRTALGVQEGVEPEIRVVVPARAGTGDMLREQNVPRSSMRGADDHAGNTSTAHHAEVDVSLPSAEVDHGRPHPTDSTAAAMSPAPYTHS